MSLTDANSWRDRMAGKEDFEAIGGYFHDKRERGWHRLMMRGRKGGGCR
jgi:hypothetical protein